jgi:Zn-finger nucleic acid-binding protein
MKCVKCGAELRRVRIEEVTVDQCLDCSGIWFDLGELEDVLAKDEIECLRNRIDNNAGHDEMTAPCPVCGGEGNMVLVKDPTHGLHIDTCPVCYGHWLDGGEFDILKSKGLLAGILSIFRNI